MKRFLTVWTRVLETITNALFHLTLRLQVRRINNEFRQFAAAKNDLEPLGTVRLTKYNSEPVEVPLYSTLVLYSIVFELIRNFDIIESEYHNGTKILHVVEGEFRVPSPEYLSDKVKVQAKYVYCTNDKLSNHLEYN